MAENNPFASLAASINAKGNLVEEKYLRDETIAQAGLPLSAPVSWSDQMEAVFAAEPVKAPKKRCIRRYCSICGRGDCSVHVVTEYIDLPD